MNETNYKKSFGFVYLTTNKVNGKKYIGKHISRGKIDNFYLGSGIHLKRAIEKYGRENFTREILSFAENREVLTKLETFWIRHFNAVEKREFYNTTDYSSKYSAMRGKKHTKETREKMKRNNKHSEEFKEKQRKNRLGKKNSTETIEKMRKFQQENNATAIKTIFIDSEGNSFEYKSGLKMCQERGINYTFFKKHKNKGKIVFKNKKHSSTKMVLHLENCEFIQIGEKSK